MHSELFEFPVNDQLELLQAKLNAETGQLHWSELQRHFARGVVIHVAPPLDLVQVAARMAQDDAGAMGEWLQAGLVSRATTEDAAQWQRHGTQFWAVVVAPWVLVQPLRKA